MECRSGLTRRGFVAQAAALGALATIGGISSPLVEKAFADAEPQHEEVKKHVWCQMCGLGETYCGTLCTVKDGKFVHVEGNPLAGNNSGHGGRKPGEGGRTLCAKGNSAPQLVYDPSRILYPMKLVGEKGSGQFERISWDEALDIIAEKLLQIKEESGPEAFIELSGQSSECIDPMGIRFMSAFGSPNWCHDGICWDQRETTKRCTIGKAPTWPGQMDKTNLLVIWGSNKENTGVNQTRGKNYDRIREHERGMKVIDIRPCYENMTPYADVWVPVRPGTDGALALAILNVIINEDLYDHDFCENWCNGFDKLVEHVQQYTPEWAAEICGLPVEQIYDVARTMGTVKPMALMDGNGFGDQTNDGTWTAVSIFLIQAITGNLDIPGGNGAGLNMPAPMFQLSDTAWVAPSMWLYDRFEPSEEDIEKGYQPGVSKLVAPEFPRWLYGKENFTFSMSSANQRALEAVESGVPYRPRAVFSHATNSMSCLRQPKRIAELLKQVEFHFIMDTHWNPTCDFCDIVLPACTQYESSDQVVMNNQLRGSFISVNHKLVEPMGESISDWDLYARLAVKLGMGDLWWDGDKDGYFRDLLEGSGFTLEELRAADEGIFVERPEEEQVLTEPESYQRYEELFSTLPNGKVQCYHELFGGKPDNTDKGTLGYLPEYKGAPENYCGTPDLLDEYPLIFSDVHGHRLAEHSHRNNLPWCREIKPYPWCRINPATAQEYGIADGDWMKVESPHGWIKLVAEYFEGIAPGTLMTRRGWWQDCQELDLPGYGWQDGGSEANTLYDCNPDNWDKFSSAMSKQTLVKISKVEE